MPFEGISSSFHFDNPVQGSGKDTGIIREKDLFLTAFRDAPVGMALLGQDGFFFSVNGALCGFLDYSEEELTSKTFMDITYPDDHDISDRMTRELYENKISTFDLEKRYIRKDGSIVWGKTRVHIVRDSEGRGKYTIAQILDITQKKEDEEKIQLVKERFRKLFEHSPVSIWEIDHTALGPHFRNLRESGVTDLGSYLDDHPSELLNCAGLIRVTNINNETLRLFQSDNKSELQSDIMTIFAQESLADFKSLMVSLYNNKAGVPFECRLQTKKGEILDAVLRWNIIGERTVITVQNITEIRKKERKEIFTRELFGILKDFSDLYSAIRDIIPLIMSYTGIEAIGIRLKEGDDYPYFYQKGFPSEFVIGENYLCTRDAEGMIVRDDSGNPHLECMCGNIICGRTDPSKPFFTKGGSFWSSSTTDLLKKTGDSDRMTKTRNRCNREGYESVALVPIRSGKTIMGLIQFNDRLKDRFNPEIISNFEDIAVNIGIALGRKQLEEQYRGILQSAMDGFFIMDREGRFLDTNDAFCGIIGYQQNELLKMNISDLDTDDGGSIIRGLLEKTYREGQDRTETRLVTKDGRLIDIEISAKHLDDENGRIFVFLRDITERKNAERESRIDRKRMSSLLRITQQKNSSLTDLYDFAMKEAINLSDSRIGFLYTCDVKTRRWVLHSWSSEVIQECSLRGNHPDHDLDQAGFWADAVRRGKPFIINDYEATHPLKKDLPDGHVHLARFMAIPVFSDGIMIALVGVANKPDPYTDQDMNQVNLLLDYVGKVVEKKRMETELVRSENNFRSIFTNMATGVAVHETVTDGNGRIVNYRYLDVNEQFENILGLKKDQVIGRLATEVFQVPEAPYLQEYARVVQTGEPIYIETYFQPMNKHFEISASVFGQRGFTTVFSDITARKDIEARILDREEKLLELNQNLEKRVREEVEKNREMDMVILRQNRLASMGEMIHNIAHQWRQPLNALGINIQNIRYNLGVSKSDTAALNNFERKTMGLIQYMSRTIDDFRNFFKIEKEKTEFSIREVILKAVNIIDATYKNNRIKLELDIETDIKMFGYPNEYAQVLLNILNNCKETAAERKIESPVVRIELKKDPLSGRSMVIITDNAGGVTDEVMSKMFIPYFTTRDTGTGIGLYMSKNIIEKNMNGRITALNVTGGLEVRIEV